MNNNYGFSPIALVLLVFMFSAVVFIGWMVWSGDNTDTDNQANMDVTEPRDEVTTTEPYYFEHLGVTMDILPGWTVLGGEEDNELVDAYDHLDLHSKHYVWSIEHDDYDASINVVSSSFLGGAYGCEEVGLDRVYVYNIKPTQHQDFYFIEMGGMPTDEEVYKAAHIIRADYDHLLYEEDNYSAPTVAMQDVVEGEYYTCTPSNVGHDWLQLSEEDLNLTDTIRISTNDSPFLEHFQEQSIEGSTQLYDDLVHMMTSLR